MAFDQYGEWALASESGSEGSQNDSQISDGHSLPEYIPGDDMVDASATPRWIGSLLSLITIPKLKGVLEKWKLRKTGTKAVLLERITNFMEDKLRGGLYDSFNYLTRDLNDLYFSCLNWRPFVYLPSEEGTEQALQASSAFDFEYTVPSKNMAIESKVTRPIVLSMLGHCKAFRMTFDVAKLADHAYLLVVLKLHRVGGKLPDYRTQQNPRYSHVEFGSMCCIFNGQRVLLPPTHNSINDITRYLENGRNDWAMDSFNDFAHKDYLLQILRVHWRRDPLITPDLKMKVRVSSEIIAQLTRDFGTCSDGITTSAITMSLRCPFSLLRLATPVRSIACRHPQCFDRSSIDSTKTSFKCPICGKDCTFFSLFVDGFVQELLTLTHADEVTIDTETGEWRPVALDEKPLENSHEEEKSRGDVIDLTTTPDESTKRVKLYIKPDPGAAAETSTKPFERTPEGLVSMATAQGSVALEPSDAVHNDLALWAAGNPSISFDHQPARRNPVRGSSISDAILIE